MVHLGVELNVTTKANLADAFALALQKVGLRVTKTGADVARVKTVPNPKPNEAG
jgi:rsbT co-antagonist protein RsbR